MWFSIAYYDVKKFIRQPARIIGLTGTPLILWFILGSGFGSSFGLAHYNKSINYLQYFFPGTIMLQLMFSAIFSTISLIDDRHNGSLKSLFVSPASISEISFGKIIGGSVLAFIQSLLSLLILPLIGIEMNIATIIWSLVNLFTLSIFFTTIGFSLSTMYETTQGYHAIMNLILVPLWLLSGSVFPIQTAPQFLQTIISFNPLFYGFKLIESIWFESQNVNISELYFSYLLIISLTIIFYFISIKILNKRRI